MFNLQLLVERILAIQYRHPSYTYGIAALIFLVAILSRFLLSFVISGGLPFVTFFPAVLLAAVICGLVPAFIVLHLSAIIGSRYTETDHVYKATDVVFFYVTGCLIIFFTEAFRRTYLELRDRDHQLEIVNRELTHRIRNLFLIANSLVVRTIRSGSPQHEMIEAVTGRFHALATSQELFSPGPGSRVPLNTLAHSVPGSLAPSQSRFRVRGPNVELSARTAAALALVLNELATNALKYGSWSNDAGAVTLDWQEDAGAIVIRWLEFGGPQIEKATKEGAGSELIRNAIKGAAVDYRLNKNGARCTIRLPPEPRDGELPVSQAA